MRLFHIQKKTMHTWKTFFFKFHYFTLIIWVSRALKFKLVKKIRLKIIIYFYIIIKI